MTNARPFVLHIDDDDLSAWAQVANANTSIELEVVHPNEVTQELLEKASVVLVDLRLDDWEERDQAPFALQLSNGLAVIPALQQKLVSSERPRAFALLTANKRNIARALPNRAHLLARANNIEWVFDKAPSAGSSEAALASRISELAQAVVTLQDEWPAESARGARLALEQWLGLDSSVDWYHSAWSSVRRCFPPLHGFAKHTHGMGLLRWMLHKILPYPCFLLDEIQLAARLHVEPDSLLAALARKEALSKRLDAVRYRGQLSTFDGPRWWRAGVDALMFELSDEFAGDVAAAITSFDQKLQLLPWEAAFPVLDSELKQTKLASSADVAQVVPDDWPPYADFAWVLRSELDAEERFRAILVRGDEEQ